MDEVHVTMQQRYLCVWYEGERLGEVHEQNGVWAFLYTPEWLRRSKAFSISPHIPLQSDIQVESSTYGHVQWFFDNLLPEEDARTALYSSMPRKNHDAFSLL